MRKEFVKIEKIDGKLCITSHNHDLYYEIYKIRSKPDSPFYFDYDKWGKLENHSLINKKIFSSLKNKMYVIQSVHQEYINGYFIKLLIRDENDSHGIIFWENLNCQDSIILDTIEKNVKNFKIIE